MTTRNLYIKVVPQFITGKQFVLSNSDKYLFDLNVLIGTLFKKKVENGAGVCSLITKQYYNDKPNHINYKIFRKLKMDFKKSYHLSVL